MSKSVYSIVLNDEVVMAVDRAAYKNGTNRSDMINEILAEYVSYITPEKRIREIFESLCGMLGGYGEFRGISQGSRTTMSLQSALVYKYNPSVKYSVELYKNSQPETGVLRVSMRTQNETLIEIANGFYSLWRSLEYESTGFAAGEFSNGRFERKLVLHENVNNILPSAGTLGGLIAEYISVFDRAMKAYFGNLGTPSARTEPERIYMEYLNGNSQLI